MKVNHNRFIPQGTFRFDKLGETIAHATSEPRLRLNTHFNRLKRTKSYIGDEFGRSRTSKINQRLILGCILRPSNVRIIFLKKFVKAKLASSLSAVTE